MKKLFLKTEPGMADSREYVIRIVHDGTFTQYNNPDQLIQTITDLNTIYFASAGMLCATIMRFNSIVSIEIIEP